MWDVDTAVIVPIVITANGLIAKSPNGVLVKRLDQGADSEEITP